MKHLLFIAVLFCGSLNMLSAQTVSSGYQDGVIYFKFKDKKSTPNFTVNQDKTVAITDFPFLQKIKTEYGITQITCPLADFDKSKFSGVIYVYFDSIEKVENLMQSLSEWGLFKYIQREPIYTLFGYPNDIYYTDSINNLQWYLELIHAQQAWDICKGSSKIKVAVVDNAVWGEHPDLQIPSELQWTVTRQNVIVGNSSPPASVDRDEVCTSQTCTAYEWSHGTHCAGMVGAMTNNRTGIASLGGGVTVMGISASSSALSIAYSREGILLAKENGARVISMSFGGSSQDSLSKEIIQECYDAGIVLVAAAGNNGVTTRSYPGAYPGVISVASTDSDTNLSSFSQYGDWVTVAAPGGTYVKNNKLTILSTTYCKNYTLADNVPSLLGQYYECMKGTSMACPLVAGLCGLMLSENPDLTPDQIKSILQSTSIPVKGNHTIDQNSGMIDAYAAMKVVTTMVPHAAFTASATTGDAGLNVTYTNTSTAASKPVLVPIKSAKWYFQGGTPATSTALNPSVVYNTPGMFAVTLVITDTLQRTDSVTYENYINIAVPALSADTLYADRDTVWMEYYPSASANFNVISNVSGWNASTEADWLTINPDVADKNHTVTLTSTENLSVSQRMATVWVQKGDIADSVIVIQRGGLPHIDLNPNSISIGPRGGVDITVIVTATAPWTIENTNTWLSVSPMSGEMGDETRLTIQADSNLTNKTRNGYVTIIAEGLRKTLTVQQTSLSVTFSVYPAVLAMGGEESATGTITVTASIPWEAATADTTDWLTFSPQQGSGNAVITVTASSANYTTATRQVVINITAGGVTKKVAARQSPYSSIEMVEDISSELQLYPNPASGIVYVESQSPLKEIQLVDLTGKMLQRVPVANVSQETVLNLANCTQGIYIVKVITGKGEVQYRKLVKLQ